MNRKTFKYEGKNKKNIRLKDILMLLSVFALSIITVTVTTDLSELDNKKSDEAFVQSTDTKVDDPSVSPPVAEEKPVNPPIQLSNDINSSPDTEPDFISPVDGTLFKKYSEDELLYSNTMDDWRLHLGVDIACPIGSDVLAAENGVVKSLYYDINFGNCLVLECDEYIIKYCSLSAEYFVLEGQSVAKGELIAKSSDSAMSEICDEAHIHFEMSKNGETINPENYIEFQ